MSKQLDELERRRALGRQMGGADSIAFQHSRGKLTVRERIDLLADEDSFDEVGVVTNIETFGLERGRIVRLNRRVTTPNTQGVGFLRQAFGNLGRLNLGDLVDDN